jgi:hypothetical protein
MSGAYSNHVNHNYRPVVTTYVVKLFDQEKNLFRYEYTAAERAWAAYRQAEASGRYIRGVIGTAGDNKILAQFDRSTRAADRQGTTLRDRVVPKEDNRTIGHFGGVKLK